ncbi:hypothetical protein C8R45DRAFT_1107755 [Mycena sanguinolenta]|nr:hypothetical protein C8R45DRAFT_1107755 [Mycena sanguinolenta]
MVGACLPFTSSCLSDASASIPPALGRAAARPRPVTLPTPHELYASRLPPLRPGLDPPRPARAVAVYHPIVNDRLALVRVRRLVVIVPFLPTVHQPFAKHTGVLPRLVFYGRSVSILVSSTYFAINRLIFLCLGALRPGRNLSLFISTRALEHMYASGSSPAMLHVSPPSSNLLTILWLWIVSISMYNITLGSTDAVSSPRLANPVHAQITELNLVRLESAAHRSASNPTCPTPSLFTFCLIVTPAPFSQ